MLYGRKKTQRSSCSGKECAQNIRSQSTDAYSKITAIQVVFSLKLSLTFIILLLINIIIYHHYFFFHDASSYL